MIEREAGEIEEGERLVGEWFSGEAVGGTHVQPL